MKKINIFNYRSTAAAFAFFIGLEASAASIEKGDPTNAGTTIAIRSVMSMSSEPVSTQTTAKIQGILRGNERTAVAFALKNIGAADKPTDRCCIQIMTALEQETLGQYMTKSQSGRGLDDQDKRALGRWGRYVNSPASIHLVISNLLFDTNAAEEINDQMVGERRRFCDVAFNLAIDSIDGLSEIVGKTPIGTLDTIHARDERLTMFRKWWKTNGETLEGSEKGKRFRGKT
jgi:hypothetical protein